MLKDGEVDNVQVRPPPRLAGAQQQQQQQNIRKRTRIKENITGLLGKVGRKEDHGRRPIHCGDRGKEHMYRALETLSTWL